MQIKLQVPCRISVVRLLAILLLCLMAMCTRQWPTGPLPGGRGEDKICLETDESACVKDEDNTGMTYEYKREDGTVFEAVQKITEDSLTVCPETGQACKRIIPKRRHMFGISKLTRGTEYTEWYQ